MLHISHTFFKLAHSSRSLFDETLIIMIKKSEVCGVECNIVSIEYTDGFNYYAMQWTSSEGCNNVHEDA